MRKKWTAKTEVDEWLVQFREKRKWQIALRRYVLEKNKSSAYAPYFGLEIEKFREWIELQFDDDLSWVNFSKAWQFDHIVPVAYFDFNNENDLRLCWNFVNIQVDKLDSDKDRRSRVDVLGAKKHFEELYKRTGYEVCREMVEKITRIELSENAGSNPAQDFINTNKDYLQAIKEFDSSDYDRLNTGTELKSILFEKDFLKRLGG